MVRKDRTAGRKQCRYIKVVPLVAEDIMSYPIISISPDVKASEAAEILLTKDICGLPVVDDGKIIGFFSTREIVSTVRGWS